MARKSVQQAQDKWQNRVSQSGQYYQQGVSNPNVDWAGPAVNAKDRRNAGLQAAMADGRIDAGIQRAGTDTWRKQTLAKGVSAWTNNTPKAGSKYGASMQEVYNDFAAADSAVSSMPRVTAQDRIQRAAQFLSTMHDRAEARKASGGR